MGEDSKAIAVDFLTDLDTALAKGISVDEPFARVYGSAVWRNVEEVKGGVAASLPGFDVSTRLVGRELTVAVRFLE